VIQVSHVTKIYANQDLPAIQDVSLEIPSGEFIALMGPSGCGKSTLLNLLGAMDKATHGHIQVNGIRLDSLNDHDATLFRRTHLGFVFQFFNLLPTLTVRENIALPLSLTATGKDKETQAEEQIIIDNKVAALLDQTRMNHRADFYPANLSGGEMQRVAISRALVHQPSLILADEPTGNLDTETGVEILTLMRNLCQTNRQTVVMATHSEEAARFADRVLWMRDGQLFGTVGAR